MFLLTKLEIQVGKDKARCEGCFKLACMFKTIKEESHKHTQDTSYLQ